jgi:hypothetical protein
VFGTGSKFSNVTESSYANGTWTRPPLLSSALLVADLLGSAASHKALDRERLAEEDLRAPGRS